MPRRLLFLCGMVLALAAPAMAQDSPHFDAWLAQLRSDAAQKGIPPQVLDDAFTDLTPDPSVVALDRKQPEGTISFSQYIQNTVSDTRVEKGREMLAQYRFLLRDIGTSYGVQPQYLVALWGIETNYGAHEGSYSLIQSLATLAYDGRRASFFRGELMNALVIMNEEHMTSDALTSSWAGAMGNCQFMPSTYLHFAVDWDHDGHRDIWNSAPDSLASTANYLQRLGWNGNLPWGFAVTLPADFNAGEADLKILHSMHDWAARGVTHTDGSALPDSDTPAAIIFPGQPEEGAYLVTSNFSALLQWNRSRYFATSVGLLADKIGANE